MQGLNNVKTRFHHSDGREFDAELGKFTRFRLCKEGDHGRYGFQVTFDWGLCTDMFYTVDESDYTKIGEFLATVMTVVGGTSDDITGRPFYILFDPEIRHRIRGIASLGVMHTAFIFADFYGED